MTRKKTEAEELPPAVEPIDGAPIGTEPAPAPPAEQPRMGGSYVRDRATGKLIRQEA